MYGYERLSRIYASAKRIPFDDSSRFILISDCHRGDGSWADDFSKNQHLYFAALNYYYEKDYTYIELGDGDELWENRDLSEIMREHSNAFWALSRFIEEDRAYFIYGNHDMVKKNRAYIGRRYRHYYRTYYDDRETRHVSAFENVKYHEGLVLRHRETGDKIFLVHGHQVDYLNYTLWGLACFLVRYLWRPLELFGVNDPTSAAKNHTKKRLVENRLTNWVIREKQMLIAGHTHRSMFPEAGEPPYFNDGSCVHPRCITGIEIADGNITLIKWCVKTKEDGTLYAGREVLAGPARLRDYFNARLGLDRRMAPIDK